MTTPASPQPGNRDERELQAWMHTNVCARIDDTADAWDGVTCDDLTAALLGGLLRQLIAERDEARAQVQRVRGVLAFLDMAADVHDAQGLTTAHRPIARNLRRALDGA